MVRLVVVVLRAYPHCTLPLLQRHSACLRLLLTNVAVANLSLKKPLALVEETVLLSLPGPSQGMECV